MNKELFKSDQNSPSEVVPSPSEDSPFFISKETINALPLNHFRGKILLADTLEKAQIFLPLLRDEKVLGFDTETKPTFQRGQVHPISLIQLSSDHTAVLIRLQDTGIPPLLKEILENKNQLKIGLDPAFELRKLHKEYGLSGASFLDIARVSKRIKASVHGLRGLCALFLGFKISKTCQTSNWENKNLTEAQLQYAATDAWATLQIYHKMQEKGLLNPPEDQVLWEEPPPQPPIKKYFSNKRRKGFHGRQKHTPPEISG